MRKRSKYRAKCISSPMLINRGLINDDLELRERLIVESFAFGYAGKHEFDSLADMRNVLIIAAAHKDDAPIIELCNAMSIPLQAIRERHAKTGKFGVTGNELQMMRTFCGVYRDFWMRQPVSLYEAAVDGLQRTIYAEAA